MKRKHVIIIASLSIALLIISAFYLPEKSAFAESISDEKYLPALLSEIKSANHTIRIIMFEARRYNRTSSSANDIQEELASARQRGVDVKAILEGGEPFLGEDFADYQQKSCDFMASRNVSVRFDPNGITTHAKLVVIDSRIVIIGSMNWNYNALEKNHETSALIYSQSLAEELNEYFDSLWKDSKECMSQ